jgi:histone-lysine N-methyltransferase SETMAR
MDPPIQSPADCEVRSVIRFLNAQKVRPADIYRQLRQVYGDTVMNERTWISYFTPESKRHSLEWHHPSSPKKPRKFKQTVSSQKVMATIFWDRKGVLLVDYLPKGTTINAERYCDTLLRLRRAIQNRRRGKLSRGIILFHDNARPHTAASTQVLLDSFGWEIFSHPPYSPDLAPSDFHLFPKLKEFLGGIRFAGCDELQLRVNKWLQELAADEYNNGLLKLVDRYNKCLNERGDYVEK